MVSDLTKIRSQLAEEVLEYLVQVAARAAEVPLYYPAHLRSLERGKTRFDQIRQLEGVRQRLGRAAEELFRGQKERFTEAELGRALGYRIEEESEAREAQRFIDERKAEGILIGANAEGSQLLRTRGR